MSILANINKWRGKEPLVFTKASASLLERRWAFHPTRASAGGRAMRSYSLLTGLRLGPRSAELKPVFAAPRWSCYFAYTPDGLLTDAHRFTLARLREMARPVLVVCAANSPEDVPAELAGLCDALWWKGLRGYDFSAYRIGLETIAAKSPHADVFVMNDSVYGPFANLERMLAEVPWDFTGFTAFSLIENHIQSYAFQLKDVTRRRLRALRAVMPRYLVFDDYRSVVFLQETRFARTAAKRMSVGALWYADAAVCGDPTLYAGPDLLERGFPFIKKSLFGRHKDMYDLAALRQALVDRGHPPPNPVRHP